MSVQAVPEASRPDVLELREQLEAEGLLVLGDGALVASVRTPAAGWTAVLGSQSVLVDIDGSFAFQEPVDASEGVFLHPSDRTITFPFTTAQLGVAKQAGDPTVLPLFFKGPCGMNPGQDSEELCGEVSRSTAPALPQAAETRQQTAVPKELPGLRPTLHPFNDGRQIVVDEVLGTKPSPTASNLGTCPIADGPLPNPLFLPYVQYFLSTCDVYVVAGACPNENLLSDIESRDLFILLKGTPAGLIPFTPEVLLPPALPAYNTISCLHNHKNRNCSLVNVGDVGYKLPTGTIVQPDGATEGESTLDLTVSETPEIIVHNNGAFGITKILKIKNEIGGTLSGEGIPEDSTIQEIHHYRPVNVQPAAAYLANQTIKFTPPPGAQPNQEDVYRFIVDDRSVKVTFRIVEGGDYDVEVIRPAGIDANSVILGESFFIQADDLVGVHSRLVSDDSSLGFVQIRQSDGTLSRVGLFKDLQLLDFADNGHTVTDESGESFVESITKLYLDGTGSGIRLPNPPQAQDGSNRLGKVNEDGYVVFEYYKANRLNPDPSVFRITDLAIYDPVQNESIALNLEGFLDVDRANPTVHYAINRDREVAVFMGTTEGVKLLIWKPRESGLNPRPARIETILEAGFGEDQVDPRSLFFNDRGDIVWTDANATPPATQRAFIYTQGRISELPQPAGEYYTPIAMNNRGEIIGNYVDKNILWKTSDITTFTTILEGRSILPLDMNDAGSILAYRYGDVVELVILRPR